MTNKPIQVAEDDLSERFSEDSSDWFMRIDRGSTRMQASLSRKRMGHYIGCYELLP